MKYLLICFVFSFIFGSSVTVLNVAFQKPKRALVNNSTNSKLTLFIDNVNYSALNWDNPELVLNVSVLLINNSNDTISYVGTHWSISKFFTVDNKNLFIHDDNLKNSKVFHILVPPHRTSHWSQGLLTLRFHKEPDTTFRFKIGMRMLKWKHDYDVNPPNEKEIEGAKMIWSEIEVFKTNSEQKDLNYLTNKDFIERKLKKPLPIYYHLTDKDRKNYILSIDPNVILKKNDTIINGKKGGLLTLPVRLKNKSKDTLKYINFTCSWWDIYQTNKKQVQVLGDVCNFNIETTVIIPPQGSLTENLSVYFDRQVVNSPIILKIGISLQKYIDLEQLMDFEPETYLLRPETSNLIWSNEIKIP